MLCKKLLPTFIQSIEFRRISVCTHGHLIIHSSKCRPTQFAALLLANATANSTTNGSTAYVFNYKFSIMEASREGFGFSYYNLTAVAVDGSLGVSHGGHSMRSFTSLSYYGVKRWSIRDPV